MMQKKDIDELGELDSRIKSLKSNLDSGKAKIKEEFLMHKEKLFEGTSFSAKVQVRQSNKIDERKALQIVRDNGLDFLLKEVVDLDKLEDALSAGEIPVELFEDCVSTSETLAVSFTRRNK